MDSIEDLLAEWQRRTMVMHISHHRSASRYSFYHRWFGSIVSGLSALVASSIFVVALDSKNIYAFYIAAFTSLLTAILSGVNSSINLPRLAEMHHSAATGFQGLRIEIEEELVRVKNGDVKESYEHIRNKWNDVLKSTPALPQGIHDEEYKKSMQSTANTSAD